MIDDDEHHLIRLLQRTRPNTAVSALAGAYDEAYKEAIAEALRLEPALSTSE